MKKQIVSEDDSLEAKESELQYLLNKLSPEMRSQVEEWWIDPADFRIAQINLQIRLLICFCRYVWTGFGMLSIRLNH